MLWLRYLNFAGRWQISAGWDSSKMLASIYLTWYCWVSSAMVLLTCLQIFNVTIDMFIVIPNGVVENRVKSCCLRAYSFLM